MYSPTRRLQRFTPDGKHIDFVSGVNAPCHFGFSKNDDMVIPDLEARVTLFDHAGNIFVVEWVEVGRVTKLRKV
jgi:hypothetical protein